MAARRPTSKVRVNNNLNPMPPPAARSRSVMSRPASSLRHHQDEDETNIQVVIRCRRRSDREIQDNTPIIVSSNGAKSKEVSIEAAAPVSVLGLVTPAPVRTYPFDLVFGPEADQALIYHEVVSPMLEEVLMGYNCTLFAYGQTGTGKTYTMQGDLTPTPMGNPSANAGMIPRVLFRLFHHLESSKADYSVKISYIELYNEELRDLLAAELSAPVGSAQPMGMASNGKVPDNGLKIFDDVSKRGVFIQGLEEILVKDSADALALLTKGSHRRQIAATKFNDHSSRSHSETGTMGDDLLKIGKLNLVDLAGSENIGRSGAENKRAREAGMINQSLLTLGRVINALVDRAQHVPYRESKLTRLLQDSLGGRTKTCIVATVSPARSNMEETLSTLDYAMRAKSIKNKPELNQRMTRNSLLKDYVAEIERLKADVLAAREKNGIFFSEETWNQLSAEQELRQTEIEEAKKQVEIVESQMRTVREEFEQSIGLLKKRDGELKETRERLKETEEDLVVKKNELKVMKVAFEEEVVVRKAYQDSEAALDNVASGLRSVANESVRHVSGLFEKLERKNTVLNSNSKAVSTHSKVVLSTTDSLQHGLDEFVRILSQNLLKLQSEAKEFETQELEALSIQSKRVEQQLKFIQESIRLIQTKDDLEATQSHDAFTTGYDTWANGLKLTCERVWGQLALCSRDGLVPVEGAIQTLASLVETIVRGTFEHLEAQRTLINDAKVLAESTAQKEVSRLREQNEALKKMLEQESSQANEAKDELLQKVSGLLGEYTRDRQRGLTQAIDLVVASNRTTESNLKTFTGKHTAYMTGLETGADEVDDILQRRTGEGKRTRDGALKSLDGVKQAIESNLEEMRSVVSNSIESYSTEVQTQAHAITTSCSSAFDRHSRVKRARLEATSSMAAEVQSEYRHLQRGIASSSRRTHGFSGRVVSETTGLSNSTDGYDNNTSSHLDSLKNSMQALTEYGSKEDLPTGATPRRRVWEYVDDWELTKSRDHLIKSWRDRGISLVGSETFLAEHLPLPDRESEDEGFDDDGDHTQRPKALPPPLSPPPLAAREPLESPIPDSLASSVSSSSSFAPPIPRPTVPLPKKARAHKTVPSIGTLTDARNIYTTRSRRVR
ncbi:kinesin 2 [Infundibulicybe gibba]|nr:kinesin 2 [Infundibulicybe gibba]